MNRMSDESEPPALRLRPRKKSPSEAPASPPDNSSTPPPTDAPAAETPALRAKPRLSLKTDPAPERTSVPPTEPATAPESPSEDSGLARTKPRLSLKSVQAEPEVAPPEPVSDFPPPPPPAPPPPGVTASMPPIDLPLAKQEKPKLKLSWASKTDGVEPPPPPADFPPPPPPPPSPPKPISMSRPPMLLPDVTPIESSFDQASSALPAFMPMDGGASTPPPMPPDAPLYPPPPAPAPSAGATAPTADGKSERTEKPKGKRPEHSPVFKMLVLVMFLFVIGGVGFGGYLLYGIFMGTEEPAVAPVPAPAAVSAPTSTAGQLIEKAREATAAHDEVSEAVDEVAEEIHEVPAPSAASSRVVIEDAAEAIVPTVVEPRAEFLAWVSQARISGVREGSSPKAFINSILVQKGDVIDVQLGIVFDGVDAQRNLVIFKDESGAIVAKKY